MEKLSIKQARERENAHPGNIAACKVKIAATFRPSVSPGALDRFLCDATRAVVDYRDLLPIGRPRSRQHRATAEQEYESGAQKPLKFLFVLSASVRHHPLTADHTWGYFPLQVPQCGSWFGVSGGI